MRVFLGITGASGAPYAARLVDALAAADCEIGVSASAAGVEVLATELYGEPLLPRDEVLARFTERAGDAATIYDPHDYSAPYASGSWLFSHNGAVKGWPRSLAPLTPTLPAADLLAMEARNDSAFVWALVLARLRAGDDESQALADTVLEVAEAAPGSRLNLLLTNGETIAATTWGDTLWYLTSSRGTVVASEPYDDDPRWQEVPDHTLLAASRTDVLLTPLKEPSDAASAIAPSKEPRT